MYCQIVVCISCDSCCLNFCSAASQDLPGMTEEEQALLAQLRDQKQTAEFVYKALQRAEHAATAAATASGAVWSHPDAMV